MSSIRVIALPSSVSVAGLRQRRGKINGRKAPRAAPPRGRGRGRQARPAAIRRSGPRPGRGPGGRGALPQAHPALDPATAIGFPRSRQSGRGSCRLSTRLFLDAKG
ncbi:hypothetical protein RSP03_26790 [Cereibacter sphaeroides]|nr:hypothetical protein RSP03_26790 [Cereibacter sphaeroides]